jgi:hypothetical protein
MSNYASFTVKLDNYDGTFTVVPFATVKVWDIQDADPATGVGGVALPDLAADAQGVVAPGILAIAAGRKVRFRWSRDTDGKGGTAITTTT